MRIRSTTPTFWRSSRVASVSWEARLVLKGLESYVDDNGVGKDDLQLIVSDIFPRDLSVSPHGTLKRVEAALYELHAAGLIHRYEANGDELVCVGWWEQSQKINRPSKGRFPRPDGTLNYKDSEIQGSFSEPSVSTHAHCSAGVVEKGSRGVGEKGSSKNTPSPDTSTNDPPATPTSAAADAASDFDSFWETYPRRVGKAAARKAFTKATSRASPDTILDATRRLAADPNLPEPKFIPHPSTWLARDGWEDDPYPPQIRGPSRRNTTDKVHDGLALARRLHDEETQAHIEGP